MKIEETIIIERKAQLENVSKQLKSEFFGLDKIIDKVIQAVYPWYVFPEIVTRPIIVNLWGMTGVGKTQLVRRLSTLLGFNKKFVELQMGDTNTGSSFHTDSIYSALSQYIEEGEQGILLLDEIQRFRTVGETGEDLSVKRFQDVWDLLSDGKIASNAGIMQEIEEYIINQAYYEERRDSEDPTLDSEKMTLMTFKLSMWEAKFFKKVLKLKEPLKEIMTWNALKIKKLISEADENYLTAQIDYSKLLIFISGNLDSAFTGSLSVEDCDTDADFYHEITSKINTTDIKYALSYRFRPEQIARMGSNHIIYPSMTKKTYQDLIRSQCQIYVEEISNITGISFTINEPMYDVIYQNSVFPTQGTRPVFSSIQKIFTSGLVNIACWCMETGIREVLLDIDVANQRMIANDNVFGTHIDLEISTRKKKRTQDISTLIASHEAGHALIYSLLTNVAPFEVKINAISFSNGYILSKTDSSNFASTEKSLRDEICCLLGGRVVEEILYDKKNCTTGAQNDIDRATILAGMYVRTFGFSDEFLARTASPYVTSEVYTSIDLNGTNNEIIRIVDEEYARAKTLIYENLHLLKLIIDKLMNVGVVTQNEFINLMQPYMTLQKEQVSVSYQNKYNEFFSKNEV